MAHNNTVRLSPGATWRNTRFDWIYFNFFSAKFLQASSYKLKHLKKVPNTARCLFLV